MDTKQDRRAFLKMSATYGTGLVIGCFSLSGCANSIKPDATTKKEKKMNEMIAYCGSPSCHGCAIYLATREQDPKKKREMRVDIAWNLKEHYGWECKPEDVADCDGCKTENGRLFNDGDCQVRKCAIEKGLENCTHCNEYPCEKLEKT